MADSFFFLAAGAHCDSVEVGGGGGGGGGDADAGLLLSELLQLSTLSGRSGLDILVVVLKKSEHVLSNVLFACMSKQQLTPRRIFTFSFCWPLYTTPTVLSIYRVGVYSSQ